MTSPTRVHSVKDAAPAGASEQLERPVVGVEDHLLSLARIRTHELVRLWHRRMCATPSRTAESPMTAHSRLQSNWRASPGSNARGTGAPDAPVPRRRLSPERSTLRTVLRDAPIVFAIDRMDFPRT